jgi:hypothetical protein
MLMRDKVNGFVTGRMQSKRSVLDAERVAKTTSMKEQLGQQEFGYALDPQDPRFDEIEVCYCNAVLQARADALLDAYSTYGLELDDNIMRDLGSARQQMVDATKNSLLAAAALRAARRGTNSAPLLARARALGQEIERRTHAHLKGIACDVEMRRCMPKEESKSSTTKNYTLNNYGTAHTVAQGETVTVITHEASSVLNAIQTTIEGSTADSETKSALLAAVEAIRHAKDKPSLLDRTNKLIGLVNACAALAHHAPAWYHALLAVLQ